MVDREMNVLAFQIMPSASSNDHEVRIHVGMAFAVRDGAQVVGRGRITKILNLAESAARVAKRRQP